MRPGIRTVCLCVLLRIVATVWMMRRQMIAECVWSTYQLWMPAVGPVDAFFVAMSLQVPDDDHRAGQIDCMDRLLSQTLSYLKQASARAQNEFVDQLLYECRSPGWMAAWIVRDAAPVVQSYLGDSIPDKCHALSSIQPPP